MMFATKPRPSRRRYCRATLSWSTRTPSNFASIAPSSGRQHDPQHEAGMSRSRVLGHQLSRFVSLIKTKDPCFRRRLFRHGRPPTCSPAPLCHVEFRTRARCGVILWSIPIAVCDLGPLVVLFVPTSQRKSHIQLPPPFGHVKDWARCPEQKIGGNPNHKSHFRSKGIYSWCLAK